MQPLLGCIKTLLFVFYNYATSTKLRPYPRRGYIVVEAYLPPETQPRRGCIVNHSNKTLTALSIWGTLRIFNELEALLFKKAKLLLYYDLPHQLIGK